MILKIKDPIGKSWWMYDGIVRVKFGSQYDKEIYANLASNDGHDPNLVDTVRIYSKDFYYTGEKEIFEISPDIILINMKRFYNKNFNEEYYLNWACISLKDGTEKLAVFDQDGYICNDSGQTLEAIR